MSGLAIHSLRPVCLAAVLAGLVLAGDGLSQPKNPADGDKEEHKQKEKDKHANKDKQKDKSGKEKQKNKSGDKQAKEKDKGAEKKAKAKEHENKSKENEAAKKANAKAKQAAKAAAEVPEAVALKNAYVLLAIADRDYDGHRANAQHKVGAALHAIDEYMLKHGGKAAKAVAEQDEIAKARAASIAKHSKAVHEGQSLSDLQLREAHALVRQVTGDAARLKQLGIHEHMTAALQHLEIALRIR
jgi:hypothetical protein